MAIGPSTALQRPDLGATLEEFDLDMALNGYIAQQVLPVIDVRQEAMNIGKIPIEQLLKDRDTKRAPGAGYSRSDFEFTTFAFACEEHGAEEAVDDRAAKIYARYFDAEAIATRRARAAVMRNAEKRAAALLFNTSTWTGSDLFTSVGTEWSTVGSATPIANVDAARNKVRDGSGLIPNAGICGWKVFEHLRRSAEIEDLVKHWGGDDPKRMTQSQIAAVLGLDHLFVGGGQKDTGAEGQATSLADIWDDEYFMVARVAMTDDPGEPCVGRTFHYTEDGSMVGTIVETYRDEPRRSDIVRARHDVDELTMYVQAAHLLGNISV